LSEVPPAAQVLIVNTGNGIPWAGGERVASGWPAIAAKKGHDE
jgi:hypothetical protein